MSKKILIDAAQPQETRVALIGEGNQIEDLDFELENGHKTIKGNLYIAKVVRIEPSLQAVFVDYGNDKQGFLSFSEIHHSYFNIPKEEKKEAFEVLFDTAVDFGEAKSEKQDDEQNIHWHRKYTVQQVIKNKQLLLVQVLKDSRGNKCAAMTTYISLVGCCCILMPNTSGKVGVSRKINDIDARSKLKEIAGTLGVSDDMSLVVRTAGESKTKTEIKRDYDYLINLWEQINNEAQKMETTGLVYEEACLVKRAIRDMYCADIDEIIVDGEEAYKIAKTFMHSIMPSHVKNVKEYAGAQSTLFQSFDIEGQLDTVYSPRIDLPSGGYIIINHTEALIAIDINSGKSTKERNVEETALKTNLEAAEEIARQLIIRNLSGIIVIDFIDMISEKNKAKVEKAMKALLKRDRAKAQSGKLSDLGLMEISRQMIKQSIMQAQSNLCPHCAGLGYIQTSDTVVMRLIRALRGEITSGDYEFIKIRTTFDVAMNLLNNYRDVLFDIEKSSGIKVTVSVDVTMVDCKYEFIKQSRLPLHSVDVEHAAVQMPINEGLNEVSDEVVGSQAKPKGQTQRVDAIVNSDKVYVKYEEKEEVKELAVNVNRDQVNKDQVNSGTSGRTKGSNRFANVKRSYNKPFAKRTDIKPNTFEVIYDESAKTSQDTSNTGALPITNHALTAPVTDTLIAGASVKTERESLTSVKNGRSKDYKRYNNQSWLGDFEIIKDEHVVPASAAYSKGNTKPVVVDDATADKPTADKPTADKPTADKPIADIKKAAKVSTKRGNRQAKSTAQVVAISDAEVKDTAPLNAVSSGVGDVSVVNAADVLTTPTSKKPPKPRQKQQSSSQKQQTEQKQQSSSQKSVKLDDKPENTESVTVVPLPQKKAKSKSTNAKSTNAKKTAGTDVIVQDNKDVSVTNLNVVDDKPLVQKRRKVEKN